MRFVWVLLLGLVACGGQKRKIRVPDSIVANPNKKVIPKQQEDPLVVKMSDGKRTWQVEIPIYGGKDFSAEIPLEVGHNGIMQEPIIGQTEADREIIEAKRAAGKQVPATKAGEEKRSPSYLATIARVRELYKRRQYEMALVDLVELDRQYPDDERILEMKGTLYNRLNRRKEAKRAWERVLSLNPNNESVARALEQLEDVE